ncbi:hypothetical protein [Streptomyces sp. NPDC060194]
MALAYLLALLVGLVLLVLPLLRHRTTPTEPTPAAPAPAAALAEGGPEIRLILAAATQLAARLDTAA